jgi:hypothetical protein
MEKKRSDCKISVKENWENWGKKEFSKKNSGL